MTTLTPQEIEVLQLICDGDYHKAAARKLGITHKQVENVVQQIVKKMGGKGKSSAWLGAEAIRLQLVS